MKLKKVFVVFKTHFDLGYTHLAKELLQWYSGGMIEDVVEICNATADCPDNKKYVWTIPSWPFMKTVEGIHQQELRMNVEELIERRQLIWHGLPFTTHTEFCGLEEFIRGLYIAKGLSDKYGWCTSSGKMTDVPGHTWMLPSILAKAGIRFLHLGSNFCAMPPDVPRIFFWEGPDGSRVLTYYSKGEYGTDLVPPDDWEYPYWLAMLQTLDNLGAQDTDYLDSLFKRAENELPGVEISIGSLDDFGNAMLHQGVDVPVIKGDLADTWIRGVGSAPVAVSKIRTQRPLLSTLESVSSLLKFLGVNSTDEQTTCSQHIAKSYENMLLFGEHTWSMDTKVTILPERKYGNPWIGFKFWENGVYDKEMFSELKNNDSGYLKLQQSWEEQLDYLREADKGIEAIQSQDLSKLAASIDINGERLLVASSLGWETQASIPIDDIVSDSEQKVFSDSESGAELPDYINHKGERCIMSHVPALGYKTIAISSGMPFDGRDADIAFIDEETHGVLDNSHLYIKIDKGTGCITSLYSKSDEKEWVNNESDMGFGQYIYDVYSYQELHEYLCSYSYVLRDWTINDYGKAGYPKNQHHERFSPKDFSLTAENGYNWGKITATTYINNNSSTHYGNVQKIVIGYILYTDKEYLDISYNLYDKQETPIIESGHFAFPLALNNPKYKINKLGSVIDPEKDIINGCNKDLHCLDKWIDINNGKHGMTIISFDMPLFSFNTPGVLKYDKEFIIQEPTLLMQAFNNAWGTNFPQWIGGDLAYRYRLIPYKGICNVVDLFKSAEEAISSPVVAFANEKSINAAIPETLDILPEGLNGFRVLAFKWSEDQNGFILRIKDISGVERTTKITLSMPIEIEEVWTCDLIERKKERTDLNRNNNDCTVLLSTSPYEIHAFYIKLKR